jgi:membrane protein
MRHFLDSVRRAFRLARATVLPTHEVRGRRELVLVYTLRLGWLVWHRLWHDSCHQKAAALAYQTMLSLVPMLAVVAAIASALRLEQFVGTLTEYFEKNLLPEAASAAGGQVLRLVHAVEPSTLGVVAAIGLAVTAVNLLVNVESAINEVYRCSSSRRLVVRVAVAFLVLALAPPAVGVSLYLTGKLMVFPGAHLLQTLLPLALSFGALFACYRLLPGRPVRLRYALVSAAVAAVLFEAVKFGFALYARHLGQTLSYVYGALAILPLFMVWMYLCWVIFLFGAELGAALHEVRTSDTPLGPQAAPQRLEDVG